MLLVSFLLHGEQPVLCPTTAVQDGAWRLMFDCFGCMLRALDMLFVVVCLCDCVLFECRGCCTGWWVGPVQTPQETRVVACFVCQFLHLFDADVACAIQIVVQLVPRLWKCCRISR
jgi:hypothetical protein